MRSTLKTNIRCILVAVPCCPALAHAVIMPRETAMQPDASEASAKSIMIIVIAASCAISLAALVVGAVVYIKCTRMQAADAPEHPSEAHAGDGLKPVKTKVPGRGADAADLDGCSSPAVPAQHDAASAI